MVVILLNAKYLNQEPGLKNQRMLKGIVKFEGISNKD